MSAKLGPVTPVMLSVLVLLVSGRDAFFGVRGRSEFGGRIRTLQALKRRGLIYHNAIQWTALDEGRRLVAKSC